MDTVGDGGGFSGDSWRQWETLSLEVSLEALSVWLAPEALAADELTGREAPGL